MYKMIMSVFLVLGFCYPPLLSASEFDKGAVRFQFPGPGWDLSLDVDKDPLYRFGNYVFQGRIIAGRIIPLEEESPEQWIRDEILHQSRALYGPGKGGKTSGYGLQALTAGKNTWSFVQFPDFRPGLTMVQYYHVIPGGLIEVGVIRANEDANEERFTAEIDELLASFYVDELALSVFLKDARSVLRESERISDLPEGQQIPAMDRLMTGLTSKRARLYALKTR